MLLLMLMLVNFRLHSILKLRWPSPRIRNHLTRRNSVHNILQLPTVNKLHLFSLHPLTSRLHPLPRVLQLPTRLLPRRHQRLSLCALRHLQSSIR